MAYQMLYVLILACLVNFGQALRCGDWDCYGTGVYCCNDSCCFSVWVNGWFWLIWVFIFLLVVSCGYAVRRRRMAAAQPEYIVVRGGNQPIYGVTTPAYGATGAGVEAPVHSTYYAYPGTAQGYPGTAPTGNIEKPPPYSPEMGAAGYANQGYQTQNETK